MFDRIYGCLAGGAIGDAMGAPVENWHYRDIRERHGRITRFLPQPARARGGAPGQVTDDTTLRHYLCLAIAERGGRITPEDYARVWLDRLNPDRLFATERIVHAKLRLGMSPWDTGRGQLAADAAIMAIAPVGLINAGDPGQAYQDAACLAMIHQDGFERDAAATMAAAVAVAVTPAATVGAVVDALCRHATFEARRLVERALELAAASSGPDDFVERFYATLLDRSFPLPPGERWDPERSVSPTSREVLPAVTGLFVVCDGDPARCIVEGAGLGRDADTIASVAGALAGALRGASALPPEWVAACEAANADLFVELEGDAEANFAAMARRLVSALAAERERAARRHADLTALLATPH